MFNQQMRCFTHLVSLQFYGMQTLHKCVCFWLPKEMFGKVASSFHLRPTSRFKHSISRVNRVFHADFTGISRYFTFNVLPILEISLSTKLSIPYQTLLQNHTRNVTDSLFGLNLAFHNCDVLTRLNIACLYVEVKLQHWRVGYSLDISVFLWLRKQRPKICNASPRLFSNERRG